MRIYWDQILVGSRDSVDNVHERRISPFDRRTYVCAGSRRSCIPSRYPPHDVRLRTRDSRLLPGRRWAGSYTREGDVVELLTAGDDLFVITRDGDEIVLTVRRVGASRRSETTRRGRICCGQMASARRWTSTPPARTSVEPLPFHAMSRVSLRRVRAVSRLFDAPAIPRDVQHASGCSRRCPRIEASR